MLISFASSPHNLKIALPTTIILDVYPGGDVWDEGHAATGFLEPFRVNGHLLPISQDFMTLYIAQRDVCTFACVWEGRRLGVFKNPFGVAPVRVGNH